MSKQMNHENSYPLCNRTKCGEFDRLSCCRIAGHEGHCNFFPGDNPILHWCGGGKVLDKNGLTTTWDPGWPVCVSGDRAVNIRFRKRQTSNPHGVTCKKCRAVMSKMECESP